MKLLIYDRIYDTGFCDLIPDIMSNALNNAIIVINKMDPG